MVLADTSVWLQHFRQGEPELARLLADGLVLMHPFVLGELACGNLKDRTLTLEYLCALPSSHAASNAEVMQLLESRRLWGRGLGWVDTHLLGSALLSHCRFWTLDRRLGEAAAGLRLAALA
jgi:predicted nucleic acid-binding protein